jgi:hypothetical protein
MATALGALGYYTGTKDTVSEQNVVLPKSKAMPWEQEGDGEKADDYKYKVGYYEVIDNSIIQRGTRSFLRDRYVLDCCWV